MTEVRFLFRPGLPGVAFGNVRFCGFWDGAGQPSPQPTLVAMAESTDETGCPVFAAAVTFEAARLGQVYHWGVLADGPGPVTNWLIVSGIEVAGKLFRTFVLQGAGQVETYDLTLCRRLGANRLAGSQTGAVRFRVWAPNAGAVDLVLADPATGYVADDGSGGVHSLPMRREADGTWTADADGVTGRPYMFRVVKDNGSVAYRTDPFSRAQVGQGGFDPKGRPYGGLPEHLDGTKSCSRVCDPDRVVEDDGASIDADAFWADEFDPARPLPQRVEDLVIYELHVGALGFGRPEAGTLDDAIAFVGHLAELGVNAVELLPISEFQGDAGWGYATSHYGAVEDSAGGADRLKHFVRACHRRGIAVILDVVYNHYDGDAERAEWQFDSNDPTRNIYYWYEGRPGDYAVPEGGYVDNESTGWAPRYDAETVRQLFVASAAAFVTEFHVDGFRVDQTTAIHAYARLHADGRPADRARQAGIAFLRQWTQTLRLIRPGLFLTAEDHSGWDAVTRPYAAGGLGFDAAWDSGFYHHLVDFGGGGPEWAKLLREAGTGGTRPLAMSAFAGALRASADRTIVYNDSHDEAGNSAGSARTIRLAVDGAPLIGATRIWAEARVRVAAGLTLLAAGTPMFFMGEEVGAEQPYRYDDFLTHREDFPGLRAGTGRALFGCYRDLVALRRGSAAIRSREIDVFLVHDSNRIVGFRRWAGAEQVVVVASLNEAAFGNGYRMRSPALAGAGWREVFNSDAAEYGGAGTGNGGRVLWPEGDELNPIVPATGLIVLRREGGAG